MSLLIPCQPIQVLPTLAQAVGLNEAIFLQQLHYWLERSKHEHDGRRWIYNTFEEWHAQFPFWSLRTMERIVAKLVKSKLVTVHKFNAKNWDRKNWYSIDYDVLQTVNIESASLAGSLSSERRVLDTVNLAGSKDQETTQRLLTETNNKEPPIVPQGDVSVKHPSAAEKVFNFWREHFDKPKTKLDQKRKTKIAARLKEGYSVGDLQRAIVGCGHSPFHQGKNDSKTVYDKLEMILRDAAQVDKFIELEKNPPPDTELKGPPEFRPDFETFQKVYRFKDLKEARETYDNSIWGSK